MATVRWELSFKGKKKKIQMTSNLCCVPESQILEANEQVMWNTHPPAVVSLPADRWVQRPSLYVKHMVHDGLPTGFSSLERQLS